MSLYLSKTTSTQTAPPSQQLDQDETTQLPGNSLDIFALIIEKMGLKDIAIAREVCKDWNASILAINPIKAQLFIQSCPSIASMCLTKALSLAKAIQTEHYFNFDKLLLDVSELKANIDIDDALATALLITDSSLQEEAQVKIIKAFAQKNLTTAKGKALAITDPFVRDLALLEIVKVEALQNLNVAKNTANSITTQDSRDRAYFEIIKIEAQSNSGEAKNTAKSIRNIILKDESYLLIVRSESLHDPQAAETTATFVTTPTSLCLAYIEIDRAKLPQDFTRSKTAAQKIPEVHLRDFAILEIVKAESVKDPDAAVATAKLIQAKGYFKEVMDVIT